MANTITIKDIKLNVGDTIKVHYKFKEGEKSKEQIFEGILMKIRGKNDNTMFTVRRVSKDRIGVERIFPAISPFIDKVAVVKKGNARRSKLYFVRRLSTSELRERLS